MPLAWRVMTRAQRLLSLLVAAAIAVGALVLLSGGEDQTDTAGTPTGTPAPDASPARPEAEPRTTEPTATPTPAPTPAPPLLTAAAPRTLRFTEGERIAFRVRSDTPDEVHVHGYDRIVALPAGRTRTVRFEATVTGIFEVELHGSGAKIGRLRVEPE